MLKRTLNKLREVFSKFLDVRYTSVPVWRPGETSSADFADARNLLVRRKQVAPLISTDAFHFKLDAFHSKRASSLF
jgi:hypothetical protein